MNLIRILVGFIAVLPLIACASSKDPSSSYQFIVGFVSPDAQDNADQHRQDTLQQWQSITQTEITFIRKLGDSSWVIRAATEAKSQFIEQLSTVPTVKFVEEDQVIRISPIEQPKYPVRVH